MIDYDCWLQVGAELSRLLKVSINPPPPVVADPGCVHGGGQVERRRRKNGGASREWRRSIRRENEGKGKGRVLAIASRLLDDQSQTRDQKRFTIS